MIPYGNAGKDSNVQGYELGEGSIRVAFTDGSQYLYTDASTGPAKVERMRALAVKGHGLNGYISRHVGEAYAERRRPEEEG